MTAAAGLVVSSPLLADCPPGHWNEKPEQEWNRDRQSGKCEGYEQQTQSLRVVLIDLHRHLPAGIGV